MSNEMNLATGLAERLVDGRIQTTLDQEIGTFCINANSRKVWPVADAPQPCMKLRQIKICPQETRDDDDGRAIPPRNTQPVIDRGGVEDQNFGSDESLGPKRRGGVVLGIGLARG
jgi:hypothetical protein